MEWNRTKRKLPITRMRKQALLHPILLLSQTSVRSNQTNELPSILRPFCIPIPASLSPPLSLPASLRPSSSHLHLLPHSRCIAHVAVTECHGVTQLQARKSRYSVYPNCRLAMYGCNTLPHLAIASGEQHGQCDAHSRPGTHEGPLALH